jgi:hypothetical protein
MLLVGVVYSSMFWGDQPLFLWRQGSRAVTVNLAHYTEMLCTFLELELQRLGAETQTLWFQ